MTGFALLDVAIGVIFTLLTFSLIASALQEALASVLNWRGRILRRGLFRLLETATDNKDATGLVNAVWLTKAKVGSAEATLDLLMDPAIKPLYGPKSLLGRLWDLIIPKAGKEKVDQVMRDLGRMPSNIPKDTFARAVFNQFKLKFDAAKEQLEEERARHAMQSGFSDGRSSDEVSSELGSTADTETAAETALSDEDVAAATQASKELLKTYAARADAALKQMADVATAIPLDPAQKAKIMRALREISIQEEVQKRLDMVEGLATEVRAELEERVKRADKVISTALNDVADWFDTSMDRVTGWYVRRIKYFLFLIGFLLAMGLNFDLIGYSGQLINNESLRNQIVARASMAVEAGAVGNLKIERPNPFADVALALDTGGTGGEVDGPPNGTVEPGEVTAGIAMLTPRIRKLLDLPAEGALTDEQTAAAAAAMTASLRPVEDYDLDGDGTISNAEANKAIDDTIERINEALAASASAVEEQLGGPTVQMGWDCEGHSGFWSFATCYFDFSKNWSSSSVISWFLIAFGCTLGGQFWFDLLQGLLKVRTSAQGVKTDLRKMFGGGNSPKPNPGDPAAG